ncbi:hypothetical protein [Calothrix sp. NIES-2100]|uniref:hypothetical protein n=1 Tax=Calothrix sp. NIES-2100 TaxID=1954172 RepID=UPI0030D9F5DA
MRIPQCHCRDITHVTGDIAVAVLAPGKLGVKIKRAIAPLEVQRTQAAAAVGHWCWGVEAIALMSTGIF